MVSKPLATLLAAYCLGHATLVQAAPEISSLQSALTILKDNDLFEHLTPRTASAILVEAAKTLAEGQAACAALSETLWAPEGQGQDFSKGLNNTLSYQQYLGKFSKNELYWIAPTADKPCRAITGTGEIKSLHCGRHYRLPTLCTHSAPLSNINTSNPAPQYQITVDTGIHKITGFRDSAGFRFDGVRYAHPAQRFKHSTVFDSPGSSDATAFGNMCIQGDGGSEDCLFLNIATPYLPAAFSGRSKDLKPVMFIIHGGGYTHNSGNMVNYDGVNLASRGDVVVVKLNYRLGLFGFLATNTHGAGITGNYGIGDMVTALKWVNANIAAFGGDPKRVTIGGESAGAGSTLILMASKAAKGLFHAGIVESSVGGYSTPSIRNDTPTLAQAHTVFHDLLSSSGCLATANPIHCIKTMPAADLFAADTSVLWGAVKDDIYIHSTRGLPVASREYIADVPIIMGVNRDEWAVFTSPEFSGYNGSATSAHEYLEYSGGENSVFGKIQERDITEFANHPAFPLPPGDPAVAAFNLTVRVLTNGFVRCKSWSQAYLLAKNRKLPKIFLYEANRAYQPALFTVSECEPPIGGSPADEYFKCHSGIVDANLGALIWSGLMPRDDLDIPFSQLLVDYWSSFAWNHEPNPKKKYLEARGYWNTLGQVKKTGEWEALRWRNPTMRWLQWDGYQRGLSEVTQCHHMGLGLNYLEN
ncbi:hypothetical protein TWF788_005080 [Orbilia oligospora]|uniref:Carboxylic ester hydrolase n=1 Tax=Orbilia oligospora TaxID=2813651 RepID=A0A7C8P7L2_ORBOL|nr:hypothetical protein TWF788_005080 [Orbilia oligospora]